MRHCFVQIGIVIDDDGVFPAHFGYHPFDAVAPFRHPRCRLDDSQPHVPAPGEGNDRHIGVGHKLPADSAPGARQEVEDPLGKPGRFKKGSSSMEPVTTLLEDGL